MANGSAANNGVALTLERFIADSRQIPKNIVSRGEKYCTCFLKIIPTRYDVYTFYIFGCVRENFQGGISKGLCPSELLRYEQLATRP